VIMTFGSSPAFEDDPPQAERLRAHLNATR
jgi:hypothetical protein